VLAHQLHDSWAIEAVLLADDRQAGVGLPLVRVGVAGDAHYPARDSTAHDGAVVLNGAEDGDDAGLAHAIALDVEHPPPLKATQLLG